MKKFSCIIALLSLFLFQLFVYAEMPRNEINYIKRLKNTVLRHIPKTMKVNWAPATDFHFTKNHNYCKNQTSAKSKDRTDINCLPRFAYEIQYNKQNYFLEYDITNKLKFIKATIPKSNAEALYAYPSGKLVYIRVRKSADNDALFSANGALKVYNSSKACITEENSQYKVYHYTPTMCNTTLEDNIIVLRNTVK
jgi:hypothetical protein